MRCGVRIRPDRRKPLLRGLDGNAARRNWLRLRASQGGFHGEQSLDRKGEAARERQLASVDPSRENRHVECPVFMQRQATAEPQVTGSVDHTAFHHINAIRVQHALQGKVVPALPTQRELVDREISAQSRARDLLRPPVQAALIRVPTVRSGRRQLRDDSQHGQDSLERLLGVNLNVDEQLSSAGNRETAVAAGPNVGRRDREPVY